MADQPISTIGEIADPQTGEGQPSNELSPIGTSARLLCPKKTGIGLRRVCLLGGDFYYDCWRLHSLGNDYTVVKLQREENERIPNENLSQDYLKRLRIDSPSAGKQTPIGPRCGWNPGSNRIGDWAYASQGSTHLPGTPR